MRLTHRRHGLVLVFMVAFALVGFRAPAAQAAPGNGAYVMNVEECYEHEGYLAAGDTNLHGYPATRDARARAAADSRAACCRHRRLGVEEGRPRKAVWIEGEYTDLVEMSILRDEWLAMGAGAPSIVS